MSAEFKSAVEKSMPWHVVKQVSGATSTGQHYLIVVNSLAWYKVRLFLDEDHLEGGRRLTEYHSNQHATEEGAMEHVKWIQNRLKRTPLLEFELMSHSTSSYYFKCVQFSDDCKTRPDKYLNRGDHVQISRIGGTYTHDAIYLGKKRVIHIYPADGEGGDPKTCSMAREDPWEKFIGVNQNGSVPWWGTISVVVYRLRIRTPDQIIECAKCLASEYYGRGKYHFALKNCQHFASYCCTGKEISVGAQQLKDMAVPLLVAESWQSPLDKEP